MQKREEKEKKKKQKVTKENGVPKEKTRETEEKRIRSRSRRKSTSVCVTALFMSIVFLSSNGDTALHYAISRGDTEAVRTILAFVREREKNLF